MHLTPTFVSYLFVDERYFPSKHTEKRTTLFHNENFVTALKSSELGESANKARCVQSPSLTPTPQKLSLYAKRCKAMRHIRDEGDTRFGKWWFQIFMQ